MTGRNINHGVTEDTENAAMNGSIAVQRCPFAGELSSSDKACSTLAASALSSGWRPNRTR
jgi:hypothetical protein